VIDRTAIRRALAPLDRWSKQCHGASLELVRSEVLPEGARVARGTCRGVGGQHSWVVLGNPYDPGARIIDPTLWSYDKTVKGIWYGSATDGRHVPFGGGRGEIWDWGRPADPTGPTIELTPSFELSSAATGFLRVLGPLDRTGWMTLTQAPMLGWPAGEIIAAMDDTEELAVLVPIDLLGMLTDRNPGGMYLDGPDTSSNREVREMRTGSDGGPGGRRPPAPPDDEAGAGRTDGGRAMHSVLGREADQATLGIECLECGLVTLEGDLMATCPNEDLDEDHPTLPISVIPCPAGVTVADWWAGKYCDSDEHEGRTGRHVTHLEV
jgi:hypothetical protein